MKLQRRPIAREVRRGDRGAVRLAKRKFTFTSHSATLARVSSATAVAPRRRLGVDADHEHYKWWALSCTSLGMLLATINSGTLIIALPDLERALHTSLLSLVWVILAYMIASTVLVLTAGRLSDLFGRKQRLRRRLRRLRASPRSAPGFAADGTELILWRIVQGIGGAFLFANAAALVTDAFPREQLGARDGHQHDGRRRRPRPRPGARRRARRDLAGTGSSGSTSRSALLGALWAGLILHELAKPDSVRGFDLLGTVDVRRRPHRPRLRRSRAAGCRRLGRPGRDVGGLIAGVVLLPLFVLIERRGRAPMLDLTIFHNRLFAAATGAAFINGLSRFALMFVFVFYFQGAQGRRPDHRRHQARADGDRHAHRLAAGRHLGRPPRLARRWPAPGMLVSAVGAGGDDDCSSVDTALLAEHAVAVRSSGVGSGMFNSPNTAAMMGTVPAAPPRHRRRRADDAAEHRRGASRSRSCWPSSPRRSPRTCCSRSSPASPRACRDAQLDAVHPQHAHRAVGARRDVGGRRGRVAHAARSRAARWRPSVSGRAARCGSARSPSAVGHDAAHDPLLRGDRAAARGRRARAPARTAPTTRRDVERLRDAAAAQGAARGLARGAQDAGRGRGRPRRAAARVARAAIADPARRREILDEALGHLDRQLELVRAGGARRSIAWRRSSTRPPAPASAGGSRQLSRHFIDSAADMAERRLHGLQRVLGTNALFSTAYGNVGSSIYYALGLVASLRARPHAGRLHHHRRHLLPDRRHLRRGDGDVPRGRRLVESSRAARSTSSGPSSPRGARCSTTSSRSPSRRSSCRTTSAASFWLDALRHAPGGHHLRHRRDRRCSALINVVGVEESAGAQHLPRASPTSLTQLLLVLVGAVPGPLARRR